jgi:leucyl aminopeptidase
MKNCAVFAVLMFALTNSFARAHSLGTVSGPEMDELRLIDRGDGSGPRMMKLKDAFQFSKTAHEAGRCAGFMDLTGQPKFTSPAPLEVESFKLNLEDRPLTQGLYLDSSLALLDASRVSDTVKQLSSNRNRYYRSSYGVQAANWIADQFREVARNRNDVKVELFSHSWEQPSVIATIAGQGPHKNEIVVIGGHEDSINQSAFGSREMMAPGADDNATGVATVLEVYRVLLQSGFKPDRTLMFMTYAAEEVGLLGSQDIANRFRKEGKSVVAVMQLDMTGFPGAGNQIVFMTDNVSPELTKFSQKLMDTYVRVRWSTDRCGYACSDHASWNRAGYSAVMPFEATMSTDNKHIHTTRDLIGKLDFNHGLAFMKLGLAFMSELSMN